MSVSVFDDTYAPTYLINTRVREVAENVAEVQTRHSDLRDNHLQEGGERREDTELILVETETCSGTEVATLHDTRRDEDLRVFLVDGLETSRALEIAYGTL